MNAIQSIHARQILDSRGNPTVEVESGASGRRQRSRGCSLGGVHRFT